jgi:hypothetical protein
LGIGGSEEVDEHVAVDLVAEQAADVDFAAIG